MKPKTKQEILDDIPYDSNYGSKSTYQTDKIEFAKLEVLIDIRDNIEKLTDTINNIKIQ